MNVSIRPAVVDDAARFAAVHRQCWIEAYSHLLSTAFFESRDPAAMAQRWQSTLEAAETGETGETGEAAETDETAETSRPVQAHTSYLVAEVDGTIVGIASAGPGRGDDPPRPYELYMIYVLAAHHGTGVGQSLLDAALGDRPASLWVAEDNPRAQAFYRRNHFEFDGARDVIESWENLPEVRMVR